MNEGQGLLSKWAANRRASVVKGKPERGQAEWEARGGIYLRMTR